MDETKLNQLKPGGSTLSGNLVASQNDGLNV